MPIVDLIPPDLSAPIGVPQGFAVTPGENDLSGNAPGFGSVVGAAFRQDNTVGAYLSSNDRDMPSFKEDGYNPWNDIKGTKYEAQADSFWDVRNSRAAEMRKMQIDREEADRKTIDAAPWYQSLPAQMLAGVVDWPTLLPGGAFVRGANGGISVARSALMTGTAAGASTAVQEAALQGIQSTRSGGESAINIGAGVLLGGLLGAGGAKLLSKAEWKAAEIAIERDAGRPAGISPDAKPVYDDVFGQLRATGMDESEAATNAAVFAARYATRAERLGEGATPLDVYRADGLEIRAGENGTAEGVGVFAQNKVYQPQVGEVVPYDQLKSAGFDIENRLYHQTSQENATAIRADGFDVSDAKARARLTDDGVPNGVFLKPNDRDIGVGSADNAVQMPVYIRRGNEKVFDDRSELSAFLERDAEYKRLSAESRAWDNEKAAEFKAKFEDGPPRGNGFFNEDFDGQADAFLKEWEKGNASRATAARARATDVLKTSGVDTVVLKKDAGSLGRTTETVIVVGGNQIADAVPKSWGKDAGKVLFQAADAVDPRGKITVYKDNSAVIDLFKKADKSTFMHESGHLWLGEMVRDAAKSTAIKSDLDQILKWFGVDDASKIGLKEHEQFARGFEEYLREGKAPSAALAKAFDQFKQWLTAIYKSLVDLGPDRVQMPDEIRAVMDRMLATDAEIAAGRAAPTGRAQSVGAAANTATGLDDNTIAGAAAAKLASGTKFAIPSLRVMTSGLPETRDIGSKLFEFAAYLNKNGEGVKSEQAAETMLKQWNFALAESLTVTRNAFADYVKSNGGGLLARNLDSVASRSGLMTSTEFGERVGMAMRRGDTDADPNVDKAAKFWRQSVFEPLKEKAIEAGLLKPDVSVDTAVSYFSRMWNVPKLLAEEGAFKARVTRYYAGAIANEYERAASRFAARTAKIDQELADLQLSGPDRIALLETLPAQLKSIVDANQHFEDLSRSVGEFHSQASKARESGDADTAKALLVRARDVAKQGGDQFADYVSQRNALQSRIRRIRNNVAGRQDQVERLRNSVTDSEVSNHERLRRMHRSLTIIESKMEDASPEVWQAELSDLRAKFSDVLSRSEQAQDRLASSLEKIRGEAATVDDGPAASAVPTDFYGMLDAARQRVGADPERRMAKRPVAAMLRAAGGVDPDSPLGRELKVAGLTPRNSPGLFKAGGKNAADNFVASEHAVFARDDDGNGYVPEQRIIDAAAEELRGSPLRTDDELQKLDDFYTTTDNVRHYRAELESLGVDLEKMSNDDIMRHLSQVQAERRMLADLDSVPAPKGPEDYGVEAPEILTARQAELRARAEVRTRLFDAAEAKRVEQMNRIAERISDVEKVDPEEATRILREAIETRIEQTASLVERETQRIMWRINAIEKADPKLIEERIAGIQKLRAEAERRFYDRWEIKNLGEGVGQVARPDFTEAAKAIADQAFNSLTGKGQVTGRPEFMTITSRGPMKDRTFNMPDEAIEDFLESNVEAVGRRYVQVMGADIELANKFGSPDMEMQVKQITDGYNRLRATMPDGPEKAALSKAEEADIRDITSVRDLVRGTGAFFNRTIEGNVARIASAAGHYNYITSMGEVVLGSLTDVIRPAMVHGLGQFMETIPQLVTNIQAVKLSKREGNMANVGLEQVLGHQLASVTDMMNPYSKKTIAEAFLHNMSNVASRWNGIRMWTDMMSNFAGLMTQNRILDNVVQYGRIDRDEVRYLAYLGIDQSMAERIAAQYTAHGETVRGTFVANTETWTDEVATRAFRAAISKDVDSIIVKGGKADVPLLAQTPMGKMILQFKGYMLASNQRVLMRGLQEDQTRFVGGVIAMVGMGMFMTYLKSLSGNRPENRTKMLNNPGWLIGEGLDRAGIGGILMEASNGIEKLTGSSVEIGGKKYSTNPLKAPFRAFDDGAAISQKNQNRNELGSFLGPTFGKLQDAATLLTVPATLASGEEIGQRQKTAAKNILPFKNYMGVNQALNYIIAPPN